MRALNRQHSTITFPHGQTRNYAYDNQGRLTAIGTKDARSQDVVNFSYDHDYNWSTNASTMLGQRTSMSSTFPSQPSLNRALNYKYDDNYQLTTVLNGTATAGAWTYDAIGNRISSNSVAYTYYKNGTNPSNGQRLKNDGAGADFAYDTAGNLTGYVSATMYTWNYANRLATAPGLSFNYDHLGRRTTASATVSGTSKYISSGIQTIREQTPTKVVRDYLFAPGIDEPLAKLEGGTVSYYLVDGLGSVVGTMDTSGSLIGSVAYDAWGQSSGVELFGYTGRETGPDGLWFYRARYYDPSHGRFISEDRLPQSEHLSPYSYVHNDPLSFFDPEGLCDWEIRARWTNGLPKKPLFYHEYFHNKKTGQSIGLGTLHPFLSPAIVPGSWETKEAGPQTNVSDHHVADVQDSSCACVDKKANNPGSPPAYCLLPTPGWPPNWPAKCYNCQTWINQVLGECK